MAFTHGKKGRLWVDGLELTSYFNDFTMAAKAGVAETTVYGLGAKTYIGGLKEGQIMAKGYFGASANDPEDPALSRALGRQENMSVLFSPSGDVATGSRVVVAYAAETDLEITTPVTGVVATAMTAQADSGLSTGTWLASPSTSVTGTGTPTYTGPTTFLPDHYQSLSTSVDVSSNGVVLSPLGVSSLTASTSLNGWNSFGVFTIATESGASTTELAYTNIDYATNTFQGLSLVSAIGAGPWTTATSDPITGSATAKTGMVAVLEIISLSYSGGTGIEAYIWVEHSPDGTAWALLGNWGPYEGQTMTFPEPGSLSDPGFPAAPSPDALATGSTFVVSTGYPMGPYFRVFVVINGDPVSDVSLTFGAAVSLQ